jgi:hypothetical protein
VNAPRHQRIARLETALSILTGFLAVLTIFWHDWIETVTGTDPDHHNGSVEWLIIVGLAVACVVLALGARRSWRVVRRAAGAKPRTARSLP